MEFDPNESRERTPGRPVHPPTISQGLGVVEPSSAVRHDNRSIWSYCRRRHPSKRASRRIAPMKCVISRRRLQCLHPSACLKNPTEIRSLRFGVPPLGGSGAVPPKGGDPNAIFRHALRGLWFWNFPAAWKLEFGVFLTPALPHSLLLLLQFGLQRFAVTDQLL